jgi:hypothetical protein
VVSEATPETAVTVTKVEPAESVVVMEMTPPPTPPLTGPRVEVMVLPAESVPVETTTVAVPDTAVSVTVEAAPLGA